MAHTNWLVNNMLFVEGIMSQPGQEGGVAFLMKEQACSLGVLLDSASGLEAQISSVAHLVEVKLPLICQYVCSMKNMIGSP